MSIMVRAMTEGDLDWVAALYRANARDALSPAQRAAQGFVQGRLTRDRLAGMLEGPGAFVATLDGDGVGALLTHDADALTGGPAARAVEVAREAGVPRPFVYGPVVVAEQARGRGVMRALAAHALAQAADRFDTAVAFTEEENTASAEAHRRLGWHPLGSFEHDGRRYAVIAHDVERATPDRTGA